ncbi:MAG: ABC transporter permease subunit [Candidatus Micrarchaeia archaeon]
MDLFSFLALIILDTTASWVRMFAALFISILISLAIGIYAAISKNAERIILPIIDIFQTLPILAFFPFVIYVFVFLLPGYIGVNAAVIFLIVTSMAWNIIFGVYEAVKILPNEFIELADLYGMSPWKRLRKIFVPAAMPRVIEQSVLSWSIGLFYLVTSEIFSIGNSNYAVKYGIGVALAQLAFSGNYLYYATGIAVFVSFVIATRFLFFRPLEMHFSRYNRISEETKKHMLHFGFAKAFNYLPKLFHLPAKKLNVSNSLRMRNFAKIRIAKAHPKPIAADSERLKIKGLKKGLAGIFAIAFAMLILALVLHYPMLAKYEYASLLALAASFARVWFAFAAILAIAFPVCIYLVFISRHRNFYLLFFQVVASIPATILLPIIVIALRNSPLHSEITAFVIFFLSGIWYIIFSVIASSSSISGEIFEVKKLFGINGKSAWKYLYSKALLPGLVTGSVTAIAAEWNASIVAEYFTTTGISGTNVVSSVGVGIGKLLDVSLGAGNMALMITALLNLTAMIILVNTFIWKRLYRKVSNTYK